MKVDNLLETRDTWYQYIQRYWVFKNKLINKHLRKKILDLQNYFIFQYIFENVDLKKISINKHLWNKILNLQQYSTFQD